MKEYVREYFDRQAARWVEAAYAGGTRFPLAEERIRAAIEGVAPAVGEGGSLVDLGCGGGQLLVHAAGLGWSAVGVDAAPGMVAEARSLCEGLPVRFIEASYEQSGLDAGAFDAVTALGLIEYLADDAGLLTESARLLRPGGRLAVSCRNRLYNLQSANAYTERELEGGSAPTLLEELEAAVAETSAGDLRSLADALAAAADDLRAAAEADADVPPPDLLDHQRAFTAERRQHTPRELDAGAREAGFRPLGVRPLHPHPLPPAVEGLSPRLYNRLALAWQHGLAGSPLGLAFCTAFVALYERA